MCVLLNQSTGIKPKINEFLFTSLRQFHDCQCLEFKK